MDRTRTAEMISEEIIKTKAPYGCVPVWFFGQECVALKGESTVIHVDPFYSDYVEHLYGVKRAYPTIMTPEDITVADLVLITHEHVDHLDPWTLKVIATQCPGARFVAPAGCREMLQSCGIDADRITDALTGEWIPLEGANGEKLRLKPIPAAHEELELLGHDRAHRYVGYLIEMNGVRVYHAGDTVVYPGLVELLTEERIDLGLLPINGRDYFRNSRGLVGNMNYREAAELAAKTGMETVIPLHYDLFEGNAEKPGYFVQEMYEKYPDRKCHVMSRGERFVYVAPQTFLS